MYPPPDFQVVYIYKINWSKKYIVSFEAHPNKLIVRSRTLRYMESIFIFGWKMKNYQFGHGSSQSTQIGKELLHHHWQPRRNAEKNKNKRKKTFFFIFHAMKQWKQEWTANFIIKKTTKFEHTKEIFNSIIILSFFYKNDKKSVVAFKTICVAPSQRGLPQF